MTTAKEYPILIFESATAWEQWLRAYHTQLDGVWVKMVKKATGIASVTHEEALDVALCYGWIDGQRTSCDSQFFLQKFTPRRRNSHWSQRNIAKVEQLSRAGRMQPAGLAEFEAAR